MPCVATPYVAPALLTPRHPPAVATTNASTQTDTPIPWTQPPNNHQDTPTDTARNTDPGPMATPDDDITSEYSHESGMTLNDIPCPPSLIPIQGDLCDIVATIGPAMNPEDAVCAVMNIASAEIDNFFERHLSTAQELFTFQQYMLDLLGHLAPD